MDISTSLGSNAWNPPPEYADQQFAKRPTIRLGA